MRDHDWIEKGTRGLFPAVPATPDSQSVATGATATRNPSQIFFPSNIRLETRTLQNMIFLLGDPIVPMFIIILVDPRDPTTFIYLHDHAHMAFEFLATRLDRYISIGSQDVVRLSTNPDLFQHGTCGCRYDSLSGAGEVSIPSFITPTLKPWDPISWPPR